MTLREAPLVVFGDDWGRHVSTMQHLFRYIIPQRPVVWVNGIGHRVPSVNAKDLRRAWDKAKSFTRRRASAPPPETIEGPHPRAVLQPRVLPWHNIGPVYRRNVTSMVRSITGALHDLGLTEPPVVVTGSPPSAGALGRLGERGSVYFCMDDFLHLEGVTASMLAPLEERLLDAVDVVVATAESLTRSKVPASGRVHCLPQGVNYDHFAAPQPEPVDLAHVPRPRIGFAGGISGCCDLDLLLGLADARPDASVVLVGPSSIDTAPLRRPNIHLLGPRPYRDLPAYVQAFDVGIIPYVLNEWTLAVDPLKLLEYLAAGIPVVTTNIPEVFKYRDVVSITGDRDDFITLVNAALADGDPARRDRGRETARQHTWERRAETFLQILDDVFAGVPAEVSAG